VRQTIDDGLSMRPPRGNVHAISKDKHHSHQCASVKTLYARVGVALSQKQARDI
jgi:hypothetical protein